MEYFKQHDSWSILKKIIDSREPKLSFLEGEIWWCNMGVNIGSELDGKGDEFTRMVVVLKKTSSTMFYALPLSSKQATKIFHPLVMHEGRTSYAVMSQVFSSSSKRLERFDSKISESELDILREKVANVFHTKSIEEPNIIEKLP